MEGRRRARLRVSKRSASPPGTRFHPPKLGPHCSPILISSFIICLKDGACAGSDGRDPGGGDRGSRTVTPPGANASQRSRMCDGNEASQSCAAPRIQQLTQERQSSGERAVPGGGEQGLSTPSVTLPSEQIGCVLVSEGEPEKKEEEEEGGEEGEEAELLRRPPPAEQPPMSPEPPVWFWCGQAFPSPSPFHVFFSVVGAPPPPPLPR